jgi:hypothetical protein
VVSISEAYSVISVNARKLLRINETTQKHLRLQGNRNSCNGLCGFLATLIRVWIDNLTRFHSNDIK